MKDHPELKLGVNIIKPAGREINEENIELVYHVIDDYTRSGKKVKVKTRDNLGTPRTHIIFSLHITKDIELSYFTGYEPLIVKKDDEIFFT